MAPLIVATTLAVLAAQSRQVFPAAFPYDQDYCAHITWQRGHYVCGDEESRIRLPKFREWALLRSRYG